MFAEAISEIARERASLLRDVEYIRESVKDADLQESFLILEACGMNGICREEDIVSKEEHRDLCIAIMQIPDDCSDEREEIDRIVNCKKPSMTIDDIMGISPDSISEGCGGSYKEACGKKDYSEACGGVKCEYCEACSKYEYCEACGNAYTEGAHKDMKAEWKNYFKIYKNYISKAKSYLKRGKYDDAIRSALLAAKEMDKCKTAIMSIDVGIAESLVGFILHSFIAMLQYIIVSIPTLGLGQFVLELKNCLTIMVGLFETFKDKGIDIEMIDTYKQDLVGAAAILVEYAEKIADKAKREKSGEFKEACDSEYGEACGKKDYSEACGGMKCEYCEACSKYEYCEACGDKRNCN